VLIVGAGVVGLALALDLGQAGLKVGILEKQHPYYLHNDLDLTQYDMRVFAINSNAQQLFDKIGVWKRMQAYRMSPYQAMQVWDAAGFGHIHFDNESIFESDLGYIIEQKVLLKALWQQIQSCDTIKVIAPCELKAVTFSPYISSLYTSLSAPYDRLQAELIVGADGAASWVRTQAGLKTTGWSYDQTALVATITTEKSHQKTAWQRFDTDGPLALLPLPDEHQVSIVWMSEPSYVEYLNTLDGDAFAEVLTQRFGPTLGKLTLTENKRLLFPLKMQHAKNYTREGCALVGDAAHVIHPLAGLGINLGLQNVKVLSELIQIQKNKQRSLGNLVYLKQYERKEKSHALMVIAAMEGFKRGFGTDNTLIKCIRNAGLHFVNQRPILKTWFIHLANGKIN